MIRLRPILNTRFYVLFIIRHKTREIIQFGITMNPTREFVRQQIINLTEDLKDIIYLIHDGTGEFRLNYIDYGIHGIKTSVKAPNMLLSAPMGVNAIAERFIGSVRREILDHFIIFSMSQLRNVIKEYVEYYNKTRPVGLPADRKTKLVLSIAHDPRGDWTLVVKVDEKQISSKKISKDTCEDGWMTMIVDLSGYAGKSVSLSLENRADNWRFEAAYWNEIRIESR